MIVLFNVEPRTDLGLEVGDVALRSEWYHHFTAHRQSTDLLVIEGSFELLPIFV